MKAIAATAILALAIALPLFAQQGQRYQTAVPPVRFAPVHIIIDPAGKPLAAYQFELKATAGQVKIVGVEGGQHAAFRSRPPYYDPQALANDRIILAAYSTNKDLPTQAARIATIHLQITGTIQPEFELHLTVASDIDGEPIDAAITLQKGEPK
ncbi:MAG: hypothetical protein JW828_09290 [Sedimentisphaerales bacterium]|nr:hypothetical protein [Sedimentisphaerales bacterium]